MLPSITKKEGETREFTLGAGTQDLKHEKSVPQGLIRRVFLHIFTTAFALGGGAAVTDGEKRIIGNFSVKTDAHGQLYYPTEVLAWFRFWTLLTGRAPATNVTATSVSIALPIPFGFRGTLRGGMKRINDLGLWCMTTKPIIEGIVQPITKLVAGGAPTGTLKVRPVFQYEPNPDPREFKTPAGGVDLRGSIEMSGGDAPLWQLEVLSGKFANLTTSGPQEQLLPPGKGRIPLYLMLYERVISTDAEASDVLNSRDCKVSVQHGTDFVLNPVGVMDHDEENDSDLNITQIGGYHLFDLIPDGKVPDSIKTDGFSEFKLTLTQAQKGTADDRELRYLIVFAVEPRSGPADQKA